MSQYIKLRSSEEFCVSQDGSFIMSRHLPSGKAWTREYTIPNGKRVLEFRENRTGSRVQVLLSDNRWYESNMHGYLHLTNEEVQKDRQTTKDRKEEKKRSSKEKKLNKLDIEQEDIEINFDEDKYELYEADTYNDDVYEDDTYDDEEDDEEIHIQRIRDLDIDYDKDLPDISSLLGRNFESLSHRNKVKKILTLYKSRRINPAQAIDELEEVINISSYDVNDFVADFTKNIQDDVTIWVDNFEKIFQEDIKTDKRDREIFPVLNQRFEKEPDRDDSIKPKGLFDMSTRSRNKKVDKLKDQRSLLRDEIDSSKSDIRDTLISIIKEFERLISKERSFDKASKQEPKSSGWYSSRKEKKEIQENIKSLNSDIKYIKNNIIEYIQNIRRYLRELDTRISKYNQVNSELYKLTSSNFYNQKYEINDEGFNIAKTISNYSKSIESETLLSIFKDYLL